MAEMNNIVSGADIHISNQRKIVSISSDSNCDTLTGGGDENMVDNIKEAGGWFAEHCPIWPGDECPLLPYMFLLLYHVFSSL